MSETTLAAETRTQFGKGAARKIRRDNKIPAVMYGHGTAPLHLTLPGHQTMLALKNTNALLTITVDGAEHLALAKDVQRDPIRPVIEHIGKHQANLKRLFRDPYFRSEIIGDDAVTKQIGQRQRRLDAGAGGNGCDR